MGACCRPVYNRPEDYPVQMNMEGINSLDMSRTVSPINIRQVSYKVVPMLPLRTGTNPIATQ